MIGAWFQTLDGWFGLLMGDHLRLVAWAAGSGILSMLLYRLSSPQQKIREVEAKSTAVRQALAAHEGEFSAALPLIRNNLALALTRLRLAAAPSILAGLPIILCLIGLDAAYNEFAWLPWGPSWLQWWATGFLLLSTAAALTTKVALRVK